jgi:hypothetical protein
MNKRPMTATAPGPDHPLAIYAMPGEIADLQSAGTGPAEIAQLVDEDRRMRMELSWSAGS